MSEFISLEEKANLISKKLTSLLENLSSHLSKEKTENALSEGNNYIKEIDNIIEKMEKSKKGKYDNNNIFLIKNDLIKIKEKFENIQKQYIINKSNQLIDSLSTTTQKENNDIIDEYDINDNFIFEENNDEQFGKNFIDEYFKENKNITEFSEGYLYKDNYAYKIKRIMYKFFINIYNIFNGVSSKTKYLIILFVLVIMLIFCIIELYFSIINNVK